MNGFLVYPSGALCLLFWGSGSVSFLVYPSGTLYLLFWGSGSVSFLVYLSGALYLLFGVLGSLFTSCVFLGFWGPLLLVGNPTEFDMVSGRPRLGTLLKEKGADLFRTKGVLAVQGMKEKFVFQAVHMAFTGSPQRAWEPDEERICKLTFIGN